MKLDNAICYSGYREGQSPRKGVFPSYKQIKEDLEILAKDWRILRLYDCSKHAEITLEVIEKERMNFKVLLGVDLKPEISNPNCPWGAEYPEEELKANREDNQRHFEKLVILANRYPEIIFALSAGNEATVDWSDHLVPVENIIEYVRRVKKSVKQPITFCENYVPWQGQIRELAAELDFISLHTYPVWENKTIEEALAYTMENYQAVAGEYPNKPVIITEAGWTTQSNGRGIPPLRANEELQEIYCRQLLEWSRKEGILTFVFEAFDEPWKGSDDPAEPEKHWGLYRVDRTPKKAAASVLGIR